MLPTQLRKINVNVRSPPGIQVAMSSLIFDSQEVVPAVVQDRESGRVLLLGYMSHAALEATYQTGLLHLWSRSRQRIWLKGERSQHYQEVQDIRVNCENNSILILVRQMGPACHKGYETCFYRRLSSDGSSTVLEPRVFNPTDVYGTDGN
jgi:phosphoribosyl-AMP cyclohydrolase